MSFFYIVLVALIAFVSAAPVPAELQARGCNVPGVNIAVRNQIVDIAWNMNVPSKVMLSMMMTAMQESNVNNLPCGDQDSVGVFQQRPSQGWGTVAQCMNVQYSTTAYLNACLRENAAHPDVSPGELSQLVQKAQAGELYSQHETVAEQYIAEAKAALGISGSSSSSGSGAVNVESAPKPASSPKAGSSSSTPKTGSCKKTYKPVPGNICNEVVKMFDITLAEFYAWNPSINHECTNMLAGVAYCVAK